RNSPCRAVLPGASAGRCKHILPHPAPAECRQWASATARQSRRRRGGVSPERAAKVETSVTPNPRTRSVQGNRQRALPLLPLPACTLTHPSQRFRSGTLCATESPRTARRLSPVLGRNRHLVVAPPTGPRASPPQCNLDARQLLVAVLRPHYPNAGRYG